jgi:hypothetical protein
MYDVFIIDVDVLHLLYIRCIIYFMYIYFEGVAYYDIICVSHIYTMICIYMYRCTHIYMYVYREQRAVYIYIYIYVYICIYMYACI